MVDSMPGVLCRPLGLRVLRHSPHGHPFPPADTGGTVRSGGNVDTMDAVDTTGTAGAVACAADMHNAAVVVAEHTKSGLSEDAAVADAASVLPAADSVVPVAESTDFAGASCPDHHP